MLDIFSIRLLRKRARYDARMGRRVGNDAAVMERRRVSGETGALMRADPSDGEPLRTQRLPAQAPYNRLLSRNQPLRDLGSLGQCAIR